MKKVILLIFLLVVVAVAADNQIILTGFRGLNTIDGDLVVGREYARVANNVDFSKGGKNVIARRDGYSLVDSVSSSDSVVSLFTYNRLDGNKHLIIVRDDSTTTDSGLGSVWKLSANSDDWSTATKITGRWPIVARSSFATLRDNLIGVNGSSFGFLHRNSVTRDFPLRAPSEPKIIPLKKPGNLTGDIYYQITYTRKGGDTTARGASYICRPVRVNSGQVSLTGFKWHPTDSLYANDTVSVRVYRVRQSDLPITSSTYSRKVPMSSYAYVETPNALASVYMVDTFSDAQLTSSDSIPVFGYPMMSVRDNGGFGFHYQYGSPTYVSCDTGTGAVLAGIWNDTGSSKVDTTFIRGWAVTYTYIDTMTGLESDTAPALWIMMDNNKERGYTYRLPRADSTMSGLRVNLYRAPIYVGRIDTMWIGDWTIQKCSTYSQPGQLYPNTDCWTLGRAVDTSWDGPPEAPNPRDFGLKIYDKSRMLGGYKRETKADSFIVGRFFLREQMAIRTDSNITYYDTLQFDSLRRTPITFRKSFPPYFMEQVQIVDNRLLVLANGNIYYSNMDSVGEYGLFNFKTLSNNDGDRVTAMVPVRQAIRVFKSQSNWNLYGDYYKPEIVGHWGCIAPYSVASGENGTFYLATEGVYFEEEGSTLERTVNAGLISAPLASFKDATIAVKKKAVGRYLPTQRKYLLSMDYGATDTTFVFDVISQAWSTWTGLTYHDAVLFDTGTVNKFSPGNTFYFTQGKAIFKYPTSTNGAYSDAGNVFSVDYTSVPLWLGFDKQQGISVGVMGHGLADSSSLTVSLSGVTLTFDSLAAGYRRKRLSANGTFSSSLSIASGRSFVAGSIDAIIVEKQPVSEYGDR